MVNEHEERKQIKQRMNKSKKKTDVLELGSKIRNFKYTKTTSLDAVGILVKFSQMEVSPGDERRLYIGVAYTEKSYDLEDVGSSPPL